ncbi:glycoside hydrolase family protein [Rufibacter tibetensis]|uniref:Glycosyl hydrolase family 43 n=1 Tax=Rufibacter tibetensis TaxID=512763 RepID=A0A0P0CU71_9BACT|nr:glycoside hydrolase family protein [Rufibacter tibetensis]ALI97851.1 glycosyl hydrolase family 43 [Rufibacter tibetensis]
MDRRNFLRLSTISPLLFSTVGQLVQAGIPYSAEKETASEFSKRLKPVGRILETEGYYVWGTSPIVGPDGKVHVFYSRWKADKGMGGWINRSEIAHAVANTPDSAFELVSTVLAPRGEGFWDGTTCHNPHIKFVDGRYCLFYMGNSNGKTDTKRIGLATADSLYGPWKRPDKPLLEAGKTGAWDDHCTTNPAFLEHSSGKYWLYYKSWNTHEYENYTDPKIRGNRKYGLAISNALEGPYKRYKGNPILDYSSRGNNIQAEDGHVWYEGGKYKMLMRDMGIFNHQYGLYVESKNGINWGEPKVAYYNTDHYFSQPPAPKHLSKYGRFERPQLLFQNGRPTHLFVASQGGKYMTSSPFVFQINPVSAPLKGRS